MELNEEKSETVAVNGNGVSTDANDVKTDINSIVNPFADKEEKIDKVEAPFGYTRDGVPKKRAYRMKKRKKNKRVRSKTIIPKQKTESEVKTDIGVSSEGNVAGNSTDEDYKKYLIEYENSIDPDAKKITEGDEVVTDNDEPGLTVQPEKAKRKYGNSLVVITRFVLPILCTVSTRLISRGKKRPESKDFKLEEFDIEMLKELAEDGAGEEILGGVNSSFIYLILAISLGANKVMDYWDKDDYLAKMNEFDIMKNQLAGLQEKYNELLKTADQKETIQI